MINTLTIDVEDYFQVSAFESCVNRKEWDRYALRVEGNTRRILEILDEFQVKATFFVLGWVAERIPAIVRDITQQGHELASHGYGHQRVYNQTRQEFREDIRRSKCILEDISGNMVVGYRAPSYSISKKCLWAFDELYEAGYRYDSSVFPIHHDLYGIPDWPRFPFIVEKNGDGVWQPSSFSWIQLNTGKPGRVKNQTNSKDKSTLNCSTIQSSSPCFPHILEIPITTLNILGQNIPIAGGGYFRLFPYPFTRWGLRRINRSERRPFVFYLHPWEMDPEQPRMSNAGFKSRVRHYLNLHRTEKRFRNILIDFRFSNMQAVFSDSKPDISIKGDHNL